MARGYSVHEPGCYNRGSLPGIYSAGLGSCTNHTCEYYCALRNPLIFIIIYSHPGSGGSCQSKCTSTQCSSCNSGGCGGMLRIIVVYCPLTCLFCCIKVINVTSCLYCVVTSELKCIRKLVADYSINFFFCTTLYLNVLSRIFVKPLYLYVSERALY